MNAPEISSGGGAARPSLYVFTPLPPQQNGLADYFLAYHKLFAEHYDLAYVAPQALGDQIRATGKLAGARVVSELEFAETGALDGSRIIYNIGNNQDCIYMLDWIVQAPGLTIIHDVSLFYLHEVFAASQRAPFWFKHKFEAESGVSDVWHDHQGRHSQKPNFLYRECLMTAEIARSARGVIVHNRYPRDRLIGWCGDVLGDKLAVIPHFSNAIAVPADPGLGQRFGFGDADFLLVAPGFVAGNKAAYETLWSLSALKEEAPGIRLIFAGQEREREWPTSRYIDLFGLKDFASVTGYLEEQDLERLIDRADVVLNLRNPTYGETSGILQRTLARGRPTIVNDLGSYAEYEAPHLHHVPPGRELARDLTAKIRELYLDWRRDGRVDHAAEGRAFQEVRMPEVLFPRIVEELERAFARAPGTARIAS